MTMSSGNTVNKKNKKTLQHLLGFALWGMMGRGNFYAYGSGYLAVLCILVVNAI